MYTSVDTLIVGIPTIRPHNLSVTTMQVQTLVLVKITTEDGLVGWGEATTIGGLNYAAESPESVKANIEHYFAPALDVQNHRHGCRLSRRARRRGQGEVLGMAGMAVDLQEDRLNRPNINSKLSKVEQYISEKFDTPIQIAELANIAGLSVSQLNRQFQNIFHLTPSQLIQKKRLDCAIELLAQDISVTEVSVRCGYADHSAFGLKFKELTSVSPRQFKQQLLKLKQE